MPRPPAKQSPSQRYLQIPDASCLFVCGSTHDSASKSVVCHGRRQCGHAVVKSACGGERARQSTWSTTSKVSLAVSRCPSDRGGGSRETSGYPFQPATPSSAMCRRAIEISLRPYLSLPRLDSPRGTKESRWLASGLRKGQPGAPVCEGEWPPMVTRSRGSLPPPSPHHARGGCGHFSRVFFVHM
jgi:hypothetical protein